MKKTGSSYPKLWLTAWFSSALLCLFLSSPEHHLSRTLNGIQWFHPLGFDSFGRDVLSTVLRASLWSIGFALSAVLASILIGTALGTSIAVAPSYLQFPFLRFLETFLAFPSLLFALSWATVRGPGWSTLTAALLIGSVPSLTRLAYVRTKELLVEDFILASQSLGASPFRIAANHLVPAVLSLCTVKAPSLFAHTLLAEATLSFLGIGAPIGKDTWGSLLAQGRDYLLEAPHIAFGAGFPLVMTVLCLQQLSENKEK